MIEQIIAFCGKHNLFEPDDRVVVAVSGGADSVALLHLLLSLRQQLRLILTVAHLDHGLRGEEAAEDARFVRHLAQEWGLAVSVESRPVANLNRQRRQPLEETARQVRYAFLWQIAEKTRSTKIAVGHSADDQAETVLMHLLRGSGLAGLRGMLPATDMSKIGLHPDDISSLATHAGPQLIRPLLETPRSEIEAYCQENRLPFRQDQSNRNTALFRNRIRLELIPILKQYNPNIQGVLQNTASIVTADMEFFEQQLARVWSDTVLEEAGSRVKFDRRKWLALSLAMQRATLRRAIIQVGSTAVEVGFRQVETAVELVRTGKTGTLMTLANGVKLRISYDVVIISALNEESGLSFPHLSSGESLSINIEGATYLPDSNWKLVVRRLSLVDASSVKAAGPWEAFLDAKVIKRGLVLRTRQPGDKFCPLGMGGQRQKVKEFMINQKVPLRWRSHIPLLVSDQEIRWICGYRIDHRVRVTSNTRQVLHIKFEKI